MTTPHVEFIVAAYAITALVIAGLIAAIWLDHRGLKKALARFPSREAGADEATS